MPLFGSSPEKPVGRRVGGREWTWSWEPEKPPRRWRLLWLLGAVALAAVLLAVGLVLGFTLSDDGDEESPAVADHDGPREGPSLVDLAEAISVSMWDGSTPDGGVFMNRCDVYLTTGRTELQHPLPDGDYLFQVTDVSGGVLLSTDETKLRQIRITDGSLRGVSGEGRHGMGGDSLGGATTVQLCPFGESPEASGAYQLWLTPIEDFRGDLETVHSSGGDFHGFMASRSLVLVFRVMPDLEE
jgi:hypothetical protein